MNHLALLLRFSHFARCFGLFFGQLGLITLFLCDAAKVFPIFIVFLHAKAELSSGLFVRLRFGEPRFLLFLWFGLTEREDEGILLWYFLFEVIIEHFFADAYFVAVFMVKVLPDCLAIFCVFPLDQFAVIPDEAAVPQQGATIFLEVLSAALVLHIRRLVSSSCLLIQLHVFLGLAHKLR